MTGIISFKSGELFHTLQFAERGWMAIEFVPFVEDLLESKDRPAAILKLLGFTMLVSRQLPPRKADHWVIVDLDTRTLETNSGILSKAVDQEPLDEGSPVGPLTMRKIYEALDRTDFTVKVYS